MNDRYINVVFVRRTTYSEQKQKQKPLTTTTKKNHAQLAQDELLQQHKQRQSLSDHGYDIIDSIGKNFKKVAPAVNKALEYGWMPLVIFYGLRQGTHKFYPNDTSHLPDDLKDVPMERLPSFTDAIPFFGSHGCEKCGILPSD